VTCGAKQPSQIFWRFIGAPTDMIWLCVTASTSDAAPAHLVVRNDDQVVAETDAPLVPNGSGVAPRWSVPRADVVAEPATSPEA
jgi:uncharacterized protein (DUF427 family)